MKIIYDFVKKHVYIAYVIIGIIVIRKVPIIIIFMIV